MVQVVSSASLLFFSLCVNGIVPAPANPEIAFGFGGGEDVVVDPNQAGFEAFGSAQNDNSNDASVGDKRRQLQQPYYRPGNGNLPYVDFYFQFNEQIQVPPGGPTREQIAEFECAMETYLQTNVTPTLSANSCLVLFVKNVNYTWSDFGTVSPIYPDFPLRVTFMIDGYTTDAREGALQFQHERQIIDYLESEEDFVFVDYIMGVLQPMQDGLFSGTNYIGTYVRAFPDNNDTKTEVDIESCASYPPLPVCTDAPTMVPTFAPTAFVATPPPTISPRPTFRPTRPPTSFVASPRNNDDDEDDSMPWWIIVIIVMASVVVAMYCCISCFAVWLCLTMRNREVTKTNEKYVEIEKEKNTYSDDDDDDDDSDDGYDDSDDEEKPRRNDKQRGGAPPQEDSDFEDETDEEAEKKNKKKKPKKSFFGRKKKSKEEENEADSDDDDDDEEETDEEVQKQDKKKNPKKSLFGRKKKAKEEEKEEEDDDSEDDSDSDDGY